jgi:O-antigen biosynthesis protein
VAYAALSAEIEICNDPGVPGVAGFLAERLGYYYDVILVSRPHNMAPFREAVGHQPQVIAGSRVIYDAEAILRLMSSESAQKLSRIDRLMVCQAELIARSNR